MDDAQLLRYSRHILLPELGLEAQEKFAAAHALVIGAGGLGAPVAQFLAAAGVGTLTLCDPDAVDLTNLQRQILYATPDVGAPKVDRGEGAARGHQSGSAHRGASRRGSGPAELAPLVARADVVLDCSDNFATRHAVNRACVAARKPLVSGAAIRFDGQIAVFDPRDPTSPCYHCLFGEGEELEETRCAIMGVFAPRRRHRRRDAGRRSAEAHRRRRRADGRAPAAARRATRCAGARSASRAIRNARCAAGR